jgi:Tfp pilus assembly protein PilV
MDQLKIKIKAFSIIESMVAMVIVVLMFSLSAMVIANVTSTGITREKQDAYMLVQEMRNETFDKQRFIDEFTEVKGMIIEKTILDYSSAENLKVLLITATKNEAQLFESKEIIKVEIE